MDLTKEAILEVERLAVAASGANANSVSYENGRARIWNSLTGKLEFETLPISHMDASVTSLDDLGLVEDTYASLGSAWVAPQCVTLFIDERRIGKAILPLRLNPAIAILGKLLKLKPKDLHSRLRIDLFDTRKTPEDFQEVMSVLRFEVNETSEAAIKKGDESIGKSVRSKVTAESEIPDGVVFSFRVYPDLAELDTSVSVSCAVVTEPSEGTISVIPYPGEIEKAILEAVGKVAEDLRGRFKTTAVICGACR